jgi:hypothetical protein
LKGLLYEKKYDLDFLFQSSTASVAGDLGIEEYVAKIIIDAAKEKTTEELASFSQDLGLCYMVSCVVNLT